MPLRLYQKKGYINMSNEINKIIETNKVTETETDPFDEALEDNIILDDVYFSASRDAVTLDGMQFSCIKPPYMNFYDHIRVKRKLQEAFLHHEFLLIYGYSGAGKSTVLTQFHEKYPYCIFLIKDFTSLSPSNMIVKMGEFIGLPLKQRSSEILVLQERLKAMSGVMFLFDEVALNICERSIWKPEHLFVFVVCRGYTICFTILADMINTALSLPDSMSMK